MRSEEAATSAHSINKQRTGSVVPRDTAGLFRADVAVHEAVFAGPLAVQSCADGQSREDELLYPGQWPGQTTGQTVHTTRVRPAGAVGKTLESGYFPE